MKINSVGSFDCSRRRVLAGSVTAYTAALIPWALAQPVSSPEQGAFVALSALLVGPQSLDANLARRLYQAFVLDDPAFPAEAQALLRLINQRQIDPLKLQATLDAEKSPLMALPRKIVTGWYMGIVGEAERARVIAFEEALNAAAVADVLKPPTYAYGAYGSWAAKPGREKGHA